MSEWLPHQTPEGEHMNGSGIRIGYSDILGTTIISVTNEEMAANPLARNWVEALVRARDTALTERQLRLKYRDPIAGTGRSAPHGG